MCRPYLAGLLVIAMIFAVSFGIPVFAAEADGELIFSEDFSDNPIGELPSRIGSTGGVEYVQVVEDQSAVGGRSLKILGEPGVTATDVTASNIGTRSPVVALEYSIRWAKGSIVNFDIIGLPSENARVNWYIDARTIPIGEFGYRYADAKGKIVSEPVGFLSPGWNRIRIVADSKNNQVYVQLINASGEITKGPFTFRILKSTASTWNDMYFRIQSTSREPFNDIYIDDIKLWGVSL